MKANETYTLIFKIKKWSLWQNDKSKKFKIINLSNYKVKI